MVFYEIIQLISHRIDLGKIKGPLADFLNNNEKFWILDNKQSGHNNDSLSRTFLDKLNPNSDIEYESSFNNTKEESEISEIKQTEKQCCCNNNSSNFNNNRLTIKQFVQKYTDFFKFKFDAQQSLIWPSIAKISENPSERDNFDVSTQLLQVQIIIPVH